MNEREALKLALEALEDTLSGDLTPYRAAKTITAIREALAQPEQDNTEHSPDCALLKIPSKDCNCKEREPVAWLITDEKINSLQVESIQRLIDRARHAHMTDIKLRINGQDEWHEADWLKHLTRTTPPQRKPLTDEQREKIANGWRGRNWTVGDIIDAIEAAHGIKE